METKEEMINVKSRKRKIIIILFELFLIALLCLVIWFVVKEYQKGKMLNQIENICGLYHERQYEEALLFAEELPEQYRGYYTDFLLHAIQLENWEGSSEELYNWLSDCLADAEENGYGEMKFPEDLRFDYYMLWGDDFYGESTISRREQEKIEDTFIWYQQYYNTMADFYIQYFDLLLENRELFTNKVSRGTVRIRTAVIEDIDERMRRLCDSTIYWLEDLTQSESIDGEFKEMFDETEKWLEWVYDNYISSYSLSEIYSLGEDEEVFYIDEEDAWHNYKVLSNRIRIDIDYLPSYEFRSIYGDNYSDSTFESEERFVSAFRIFERVEKLFNITDLNVTDVTLRSYIEKDLKSYVYERLVERGVYEIEEW